MPLEQQFIASVGEHQAIIHKVCNLYTREAQDKRDLFQEILLAAWKGYGNFKGDAKFSTWLYRVALNTAITFYRKDKRQLSTTTLPETFQPAAEDSFASLNEQVKAMYGAINELSAIDKAIVMLYIEDYNYNDIGEMVGITANNVAVKMNRIKLKLRENAKRHLNT